MSFSPLRFSYVRYTSCSGCQLMLLNLEHDLEDLASLIMIDGFSLVSSEPASANVVDLALVEGSIATPRELEHLLGLRKLTKNLVAVGLCAITGGINTLVKTDCSAAISEVYGPDAKMPSTFHPQPIHNFVRVDGSIPGCPPERSEIVNWLGAVLRGGQPGRQVMPVCMECRMAEHRCLLIEDKMPCLGPVTSGGCGARCPAIGVGCEGCRGAVAEANQDEMVDLLIKLGMPKRELERRLNRFGSGGHD